MDDGEEGDDFLVELDQIEDAVIAEDQLADVFRGVFGFRHAAADLREVGELIDGSDQARGTDLHLRR